MLDMPVIETSDRIIDRKRLFGIVESILGSRYYGPHVMWYSGPSAPSVPDRKSRRAVPDCSKITGPGWSIKSVFFGFYGYEYTVTVETEEIKMQILMMVS